MIDIERLKSELRDTEENQGMSLPPLPDVLSRDGVITEKNVRELKVFFVSLREKISDNGGELGKYLNDIAFQVDSFYQRVNNLSPDDWEL
jgi:hypothetical protein